jgi:hypothetical protein
MEMIMKETTFTAEEMGALRTIVDYAAKCCREDTIGLILYSGAFHSLDHGLTSGPPYKMARGEDAIVAFARKLDEKEN